MGTHGRGLWARLECFVQLIRCNKPVLVGAGLSSLVLDYSPAAFFEPGHPWVVPLQGQPCLPCPLRIGCSPAPAETPRAADFHHLGVNSFFWGGGGRARCSLASALGSSRQSFWVVLVLEGDAPHGSCSARATSVLL